MFGSFGSQTSTWAQPANATASAPGAPGAPVAPSRASTGYAGGRASIGVKDYDMVRQLGEGSLPTTLKHLSANKKSLTPTEMIVDGRTVSNVRLVGMVVPGSIESTNGEFLFRFTDNTIDLAYGDEEEAQEGLEKCPMVLYSSPGGDGIESRLKDILEKATPRGGVLLQKVVITGQVGAINGQINIRCNHVRPADLCEGIFFHPMECLHATVLPKEESPTDAPTGRPISTESLGTLTPKDLLVTPIPAIFLNVCVDIDNPLEKEVATAIQYLAIKTHGEENPDSNMKFVKIDAVLDLLEKVHGGSREVYLSKIKDKIANYEWYSQDEDLEEDVYFLNE